jgi:hypothetical protein
MFRTAVVMCVALGWAAGCGGATPTAPAHVAPPRMSIAFRFVDPADGPVARVVPPSGTAAAPPVAPPDAPRTRVLLAILRDDAPRRTEFLGDFPGVCDHEPLAAGMLLRSKCALFGPPTLISVTREGDALLVRTNDEVTHRFPIPAKAELRGLQPPSLPMSLPGSP